jgi:hypothetical protein
MLKPLGELLGLERNNKGVEDKIFLLSLDKQKT